MVLEKAGEPYVIGIQKRDVIGIDECQPSVTRVARPFTRGVDQLSCGCNTSDTIANAGMSSIQNDE